MENALKEKICALSDTFWNAMKNSDGETMRAIADPGCMFVHIGTNADLEKEISYYTEGKFQPSEIVIHGRDVHLFGDTAVVLSDADYGLLLGGKPTTHHFMVTEVYQNQNGAWKLIQFSFTALVH